MRNIVILISGSGSNMAAIAQTAQRDAWHQKFQARVCAVISNRPDAKGLHTACELGLPPKWWITGLLPTKLTHARRLTKL